MVKIQAAEGQIVTHYEVYGERPSDCDLLLSAIAVHEQFFGRKPYLDTADAGFFSQRNENAAQARGIMRLAIPNRYTKSAQRKKLEKSAGSATPSDGVPIVKGASTFSSAAMV